MVTIVTQHLSDPVYLPSLPHPSYQFSQKQSWTSTFLSLRELQELIIRVSVCKRKSQFAGSQKMVGKAANSRLNDDV